ncbi:MAG TPA: hypothetical protein DCY01_02125 [Ruminococcus sp.]|nr:MULTISPECIES: cysteine peptidase family C39 domain-containing protein [Ruminococcus]RGH86158.1 hypothetical protein DW745_09165 [Ruminococcus sp. AM28-29LB]RGU86082.1 hypothetical protein DWW40_01315 [Ruminococcus bromii]HBA01029.1 hypothetical protein [Ruminococcus sp.]
MNWYIMIRFKCILQNDETDCGLACQAAIFRKYGLKVTIAKIRDIAGTDRQGTNAHGLVKVIEHFGFQQKVVEADKSVLTNKLPLPAIAHVIIDDSLLHYVVITKVKGDTVVVSDPAKGIAKVLYVTFNY